MVKTAQHAVEQDTMKAIGMMSLAVCFLSAMDLALKQLLEHYPRWIGTAVIVSSGLYIIFREHRLKRRQQAVVAGSSLTNQTMIDYSSKFTNPQSLS